MAVSSTAVIGDSLRFFARNVRYLMAVGAPYLLASAWLAAIGAGDADAEARPLAIIPFVLTTWLALPLAVNAHRAVLDGLRPLPLPLGTLFRVGAAEMKFLLCTFLATAPAVVGLGMMIGGFGVGSLLAVIIAVPVFVFGILLSVRLNPSMAAAAMNLRAPWSVGWTLSRGHFWTILRTLALALIVSMLLGMLATMPLVGLLVVFGTPLNMDTFAGTALISVVALLQGTVNTALTLFLYVVSATLFGRLREGAAQPCPRAAALARLEECTRPHPEP